MKPIRYLDGLGQPPARLIRVCKDSCQTLKYLPWLLLVVAVYVLILVAYTPTNF